MSCVYTSGLCAIQLVMKEETGQVTRHRKGSPCDGWVGQLVESLYQVGGPAAQSVASVTQMRVRIIFSFTDSIYSIPKTSWTLYNMKSVVYLYPFGPRIE